MSRFQAMRQDRTYRFLRVNEATATFKIYIRMHCCGAVFHEDHFLDPENVRRCLFCNRLNEQDPRTTPLEQERDMAHCAFTKVSRYVS